MPLVPCPETGLYGDFRTAGFGVPDAPEPPVSAEAVQDAPVDGAGVSGDGFSEFIVENGFVGYFHSTAPVCRSRPLESHAVRAGEYFEAGLESGGDPSPDAVEGSLPFESGGGLESVVFFQIFHGSFPPRIGHGPGSFGGLFGLAEEVHDFSVGVNMDVLVSGVNGGVEIGIFISHKKAFIQAVDAVDN